MDTSPLKRFPAEVRVQIHEHVLTHDSNIHLLDRGGKIICGNAPHSNDHLHLLALTATCKTIRSESRSVFYSCNTFFWNSTPDISVIKGDLVEKYASDVPETRVFKKWLNAIGQDNAKAIGRLTFDMGFWSSILPVDLRLQTEWWEAAQEGARALKMTGLVKSCELSVHLTCENYPTSEDKLHCHENGGQTLRQSFDLLLPLKNPAEAKAEVQRAFRAQLDMYEMHRYHGRCDVKDENRFNVWFDLGHRCRLVIKSMDGSICEMGPDLVGIMVLPGDPSTACDCRRCRPA